MTGDVVQFLSGPLDGQVRSIPVGRREVHALKDDGTTMTYIRGTVAGETQDFPIFYPTGWTGDAVMRFLLKKAQA